MSSTIILNFNSGKMCYVYEIDKENIISKLGIVRNNCISNVTIYHCFKFKLTSHHPNYIYV